MDAPPGPPLKASHSFRARGQRHNPATALVALCRTCTRAMDPSGRIDEIGTGINSIAEIGQADKKALVARIRSGQMEPPKPPL